jgi:hypothetical protein
MKGFRFYLEYPTNKAKRQGTVKVPGPHMGTVVAIATDLTPFGSGKWEDWKLEGYSAVYEHADSAVCWGSASLGYLRDNTRRIPEALARQIHPALFQRMAEDEARDKAAKSK